MGNWVKPTLAERLTELCCYYSEILPHLSIKIGSVACFTANATKYRNDAAHGNVIIEEMDFYDLYFTYKHAQILLYICILTELEFSHEKIKELLRVEILKNAIKPRLERTFSFLDPNTVTVYNWIKEIGLSCRMPKILRNDPDLGLKIIKIVEKHFGNQLDELEYSADELASHKYDYLSHPKIAKEKLLADLSGIIKKEVGCISANMGGMAIALWCGCFSVIKAVSSENNRGPNMHHRSDIFQSIEKLSSENAYFRTGAEVGILWKLENNETDVYFDEAAVHWSIRKYENLYNHNVNASK